MKREIIIDPNPILREPAEQVDVFDMELQVIIDDMVETMRAGNGIGLAAPQIGIPKKIIVCELEQEVPESSKKSDKDSIYQSFPLTIICNPKIISLGKEKCQMVEGCLSFPGFEIVVSRPKTIMVEGQDRYGQPISIKADKIFSRVLQHEYDHLNSTLLIDHLKEIHLVLFASGNFSLKTLEYLYRDKQYHLSALVTTSQFSQIRGKKADSNTVKKFATKLGVKIIETDNLNNDSVVKQIANLKADIGVAVDFGLKIPNKVINIFEHKILNIHPSILPRYRGSSPIQSAILNGDRYTGITIMQIEQKMDAGPIVTQYKVKLRNHESFLILKEYLAELGASVLLDAIPYYITKEISPRKQKESRATYTSQIKKDDGEVRLTDDPVEVERKIRAYSSWPGVYVMLDDMRIKITAAHLNKSKQIIIDKVRPAGKNDMSYKDFVNGYKKELTFGSNIDIIDAN